MPPITYMSLSAHCLEQSHWYMCFTHRNLAMSYGAVKPSAKPKPKQILIDNLLPIGPSKTQFRGILFDIQTWRFNKIHFKLLSTKCRTFCSGLFTCLTPAHQFTLHGYSRGHPHRHEISSIQSCQHGNIRIMYDDLETSRGRQKWIKEEVVVLFCV